MRRRVAGLITVVLLAFLLTPHGVRTLAAVQTGDPPPDLPLACEATRAGSHDLQMQVALLSDMDAPLDANSEEALAGRLGSTRDAFVEAYGDPVLYLGPNLAGLEVEDAGQTIVEFAGDRAVQIILLPARPGDTPSTEPEPADWSLETASRLAERFLPKDAMLDEAQSTFVDHGLVVAGCSTSLQQAVADGERGSGPMFFVHYTMPTDETVSAVTITIDDAPGSGASVSSDPPTATATATARTDDADSSTSRASSQQNGVRLTFLDSDLNAQGTEDPGSGKRYVAVEVILENRSNETLRYVPEDFHVTDSGGRAYPAVSGGVDPAVTQGELAPGDAIRGWISFEVPEDAELDRFVYTRPGSTMRFGLP